MITKVIVDGRQVEYSISDEGVVTNLKTGRVLKGTWKRISYHSVQLFIEGKEKSCTTCKLLKDAFLNNPIEEIPIEVQEKVKQVLIDNNNFRNKDRINLKKSASEIVKKIS